MSWEERTTERSPAVQRSRLRAVHQARLIVNAAIRVIAVKGDAFTTQEVAREAGVALKTFYRYFASKDELMLAVIGDSISLTEKNWAAAVVDLHDPVERLRRHIMSIFETIDRGGDVAAIALFIVSTHWRLQRILPVELAAAEQPIVDLVRQEIEQGRVAGLLNATNPGRDAGFVMELIRSVLHQYAYSPDRPAAMREELWLFCLKALGGVDPLA